MEKRFDEMFDGIEVLPDSLLSEHDSSIDEGDKLRASELLVPISYRQYAQIVRAGASYSAKDDRGHWPIIVSVPYTSEIGLDLGQLMTQLKENEEPGI